MVEAGVEDLLAAREVAALLFHLRELEPRLGVVGGVRGEGVCGGGGVVEEVVVVVVVVAVVVVGVGASPGAVG